MIIYIYKPLSLVLLLLNICYTPLLGSIYVENMFIPLSWDLFLLNICLYPSPWFYPYWTLYPSPWIYSYWTYVYTPLLGSTLIEHMFIPLSMVLLLLKICVYLTALNIISYERMRGWERRVPWCQNTRSGWQNHRSGW